MNDWTGFFPLKKPRKEQIKILDILCESIMNGKKTFIMELGTGVGKSVIAATLARWLHHNMKPPEGFGPGSVVLTSQRILQNQYVRDFNFAKDLRSANNFRCNGPVGGTCGDSNRVRKAVGKELAKKLSCGQPCPYRVAKEEYTNSVLGITNYSYFLSETVYAKELPARHMLILDEAHNIEDEVRSWASIEINDAVAKQFNLKLPFGASDKEATFWLHTLRERIDNRLKIIKDQLSIIVKLGKLGDRNMFKLAKENDSLDKWYCQINRLLQSKSEILISYRNDNRCKLVRYQPLEIRNVAKDILYDRAHINLLMSATILDFDVFSNAVGIDDYVKLNVPSPFDTKAFNVKFRSIGEMTRKHIDESMIFLPHAIKKILKEHPNEKGIIHTVNYKIAESIMNIKDDRLISHDSTDREDVISHHVNSKQPTVLVSPSMMEGLDLRDNLGRFQVICKMPYPDLSDPIVKKKDIRWYMWRTARSLVQSVGRCVRSSEDWTTTYILDGSFNNLRRKIALPTHLAKNIKEEDAI